MKRFCKSLLVLAVLIAACILLNPTKAQAATVDDLTFELSRDGTGYTVTECKESAEGELTIPATYNGKPVTAIGEAAFAVRYKLTNVTIPNGVTTIGKCAFYWCSFTSITIPNSVTTIGEAAFEWCGYLTSVTISDSVTTIGNCAFKECTRLTSVTIGNGVATIGNSAFYGCTSLTDVYYGGSEEQWNAIEISDGNEWLQNATIHFPDPCASGHTEEILPGKVPTCTETGLTEGKKCTVCGEILVAQEELKMTDHDWIAIPGKDPTCVETGLTEGEKCSVCGEISVEQGEIDTLEHEWILIPGKDPTCTESGWYEGEMCELCREFSIEPEEIEPLGHTPGEPVKEKETDIAYDLVTYCETCGGELSRETVVTTTHTFTDENDAVCNDCGFIRQMVDTYDFVNYRVVLSDSDTTHKNHRVIVYKLGGATVTDPSNEKALKAIDPTAKTVWQAAAINKLLLTDAGNYVVMLKYNVGTATVSVPKVLTLTADPKLIIDSNNKLTVLDADKTHINHRAVVYYLGENTVENIRDVEALKAIDAAPETVWQASAINRLTLTKASAYVLHLQYNIGTSAAYTVAQQFAVDAIPTLKIDQNNMLKASDENTANKNHRVVIYNMGESTVEDIFDEKAVAAAAVSSKTVWGMKEINKIEITEGGNYIVHLVYNNASGAKRLIAAQAKLYERPVLTVTEENKLNAAYVDAAVITHPRATYYYFGQNAIDGLDIYDTKALKAAATKVSSTIWNLAAINKTTLTDEGNYVIHLDYNEKTGGTGSAKKTVAIATTVYDPTKPVITNDTFKLQVTDSNLSHSNHRATIYYVGDAEADIYDEAALMVLDPDAKTQWELPNINKMQMVKIGKYVVYLTYNLANGETQTMVEVFTITLPVPSVWLEESGQIGTTVPAEVAHRNYEIYYLGDRTVEDIYDIEALKAIDPDPICFDNQKQIAERGVLTEKGNYVLVMYFNYEGSHRQYIAEFATLS